MDSPIFWMVRALLALIILLSVLAAFADAMHEPGLFVALLVIIAATWLLIEVLFEEAKKGETSTRTGRWKGE